MYKLLTPGPLTTSETVKNAMLIDHCTWDQEYKEITQWIRKKLLDLAQVSEGIYTTVLMQGSGSFGVESVLSSVIRPEDTVLICSNGAYGQRMINMCECLKLN
ncbi:TPA: 2-aminoethylphosphonate--pyruvate aminotransferase, partial [Enterococcus faecium]|nr:2-aminoethylphosphonate--pyruvate aminotransferase [Enterococcus faecium]